MWQVQMQFIPGNSQIWVAKLNPDDSTYEYVSPLEAATQASAMQAADTSGRQYTIVQI